MEEDNSFSDFWKITYKEGKDFNKFLEALDDLVNNGNIKIALLNRLPAPLEILINEYDPNFKIEYREITGPNLTLKQNLNILNVYLGQCEYGEDLYIIDKYFFTSRNVKNYCDLLTSLFKYYKKKRIIIYCDCDINQTIYNHFYQLLQSNGTKLILKNNVKNLHDRFYLSNKEFGFSIGTSLNGYLLREGRISKLNDNEYKKLFNKYSINI